MRYELRITIIIFIIIIILVPEVYDLKSDRLGSSSYVYEPSTPDCKSNELTITQSCQFAHRKVTTAHCTLLCHYEIILTTRHVNCKPFLHIECFDKTNLLH